ncbi:MAG: hypothetical protein H7Y00_13100, partial [Fimbriimonadaceae bacterium]|nr:hypothetical protein [Chitinophagales bacterium]
MKYFVNIFSQGFLLSFLLISTHLFSQTEIPGDTVLVDSTQRSEYVDAAANAKVEYYTGKNIHAFHTIDTSLEDFQKFNSARRNIFQDVYLSNFGAASYSKYFSWNRDIGFDAGRNQFELYQYDIDSMKYYRTNTPFSDLYYVIGTNSEQLFHVKHAQNFGPQMNVTIDFEKMASEGFYVYDKKSFSNLALTSWFETKDELYHVQGAFVRSTLENNENGGLVFSNIFNVDSQFNLTTYNTSAITEWKNFQAELHQSFSLAKKKHYAINDSTMGNYFVPYLQLNHTFGFSDHDYLFEDTGDSSYYAVLYSQEDTLRDISDIDGFYNRFSISNPANKIINKDSSVINNFLWEIFAEQQQYELADQKNNYQYKNFL